MALPVAFQEKMKGLLGDEYEMFLNSFQTDRAQGLRVNTGKADLEDFVRTSPFTLRKIPWALEGYYYGREDRPGRHPFHEAGVYYIQEPSAMAAAQLLDPKPGDCVLDLCAAPGGKTTHIAERLAGEGLLVSNEIHPARAKILSQNVERLGIVNAVVTNEPTDRLRRYFLGFFDKILVDAPCSGEGMFRKDENAVEEWSLDNVKRCAARQAQILDDAAGMLKADGRLLYSTCTFSPEENEGTIQHFLRDHPEFSIERVEAYEGFSPGKPEWIPGGRPELKRTFRIWPHRLEGEGHYLAALRKEGGNSSDGRRKWSFPLYFKDRNGLKQLEEFCRETLACPSPPLEREERILFGDQLYLLPRRMIDMDGLKVVRPGLHLGTFKKSRFEPAHALALALRKEELIRFYDMASGSEEVRRYLRGEALSLGRRDESKSRCRPEDKGWVLMTTDGYSLGFAKLNGGVLKNHYPKGLRWLQREQSNPKD